MLAFLLATKALALWAAASGFLGYTLLVDDGPARAVQAYAKLGLQRTLESRKLLAHSAPISRTLHGAPLFPMAPSINVPGAPINESLDSFLISMASGSHTTEPSYHSATSASTHAPTKTHNSPRYLPVLGPSNNAAPRATLAEQARTLQPQPSLGNQLPSALLPHDLFTSIVALPNELSFKAQLCLVFGGLALGLGICAFWRISVARVKATARLDRKYRASFVNALAKDGDLQARLRSLQHLSREIAVEAACSGTPIPLVLTSILDETIEGLKKQQLKIDLGEIVLPEVELKREIRSLQTTSGTLREANRNLEAQRHHLSKANQKLTHEVEQARATRKDLDEKCQGLVSENRKLEQVNGDLECQLEASNTRCSDLAEELTDCKAQNQQLAHVSEVTKAKMDQAGEKLSNLKKTCDFHVESAKKYRMDAKRSDKGLLDSQLEVQGMVEEKKATAKELKMTKEENAALADKVTELLTASPSSSHHAPASFNASSYQSVPDQARNPPTHTTRMIQSYEARVAGQSEQLAAAMHRISVLESRLRASGSNMPGANQQHFQAPFHHPTPDPSPFRIPSFPAGGGVHVPAGGEVHGFGTDAHFHDTGIPMGHMIAPIGYSSFPQGGPVQWTNPGWPSHPQTHGGPVYH